MLARATLFALDRGVAAASISAAVPALAGLDPLVRALAARRVRRALARATTLTTLTDEAHLARVAFLLEKKGMPDAELDDAAAVAREHEAARATVSTPRRGPWVLGPLLLSLMLLAGGSIAAWVATRPFDPRASALGTALGVRLPRLATADGKADAASWLPANERAKLPPEVATALDASAKTMLAATGAPDDPRARLDAFHAAVGALDDALAKAGAPYYVDSDALSRRSGVLPYTLTFYVEREVTLAAAGRTERALYLRRLDDLNVSQGALGYTHPRASVAMVLLDETESLLVTYVLPALAADAPLELCDPDSLDPRAEWQAALRKRAGEVVRAEFARVADDDLREVGRLLNRRAALLKSWETTLLQLGLRLTLPTRLVPEGDYSAELRRRIGARELVEWDDLHASLLSRRLYGAFARARDLSARGTERHEVQHRLDYARGFTGLPDELSTMVRVTSPEDLAPGTFGARLRAEYSAYLAQLADGPSSPQMGVLELSRFMFDARDGGGVYPNTAFAIIRALGKQLAIDGHDRLIRGGRPVRETLARVVLALWGKTEAELRAAARAAWAAAFGGELAGVREVGRVERVTWRH